MNLVDTDAPDPPGAPPPPPPPPKFEHRRVSVSFLFTAAVLVGTVVTIFTVFPARHEMLVDGAIDAHRGGAPWDLAAPDEPTLTAWTMAAVGREPPLPAHGADLAVVGVRTIEVLKRPAAVIRYRLGAEELTFVVQREREVERRRVSRTDGPLAVEAWRRGPFTCVAIGPAATATAWRPRLGVPET